MGKYKLSWEKMAFKWRLNGVFLAQAYHWLGGLMDHAQGAKNATFCATFSICIKTRSFYQDRLGTNIGKAALRKRTVFLQACVR
jgi:hypothetical protein